MQQKKIIVSDAHEWYGGSPPRPATWEGRAMPLMHCPFHAASWDATKPPHCRDPAGGCKEAALEHNSRPENRRKAPLQHVRDASTHTGNSAPGAMEKGGVVTELQPLDVLTLMFRCAELGGVDRCAFKLAEGSLVGSNRGHLEPLDRSYWMYPECINVYSSEGLLLHDAAAVQCIAEQRVSSQAPAQIVDIAPKASRECCCQLHLSLRAAAQIAKLIGQHPLSNEE